MSKVVKNMVKDIMRNMEMVDMHVHLHDANYGGELGEVMSRAREQGVGLIVCNATSQRDWGEVLGLAKEYTEIVPFLGVHPMYMAGRSGDWLEQLEEIAGHNRCGIGEIGLDRREGAGDEGEQDEVFISQMELAARLDLPATIHCVRAWGRMIELLGKIRRPRRMLFHAYGGSAELVKELTELGGYFSFAATMLDERHRHSRESLAVVRLDRLMLETDSPDLIGPDGKRLYFKVVSEKFLRNEPANVALVYKGVAELLSVGEEKLKEQVYENARRFLAGVVDL
ncbi:MAG: hypothetical protein A2Y07_11235 [Planctomycetes bacterium GWF2_50_10]|nr:MAG: hypothetical protein A2Y07_11235 [Planctomycetes bacterium GWF2_50_10]